MAMTDAQVLTEITTDPAALGYANKSAGGQQDLINSDGSATAPVDRIFVSRLLFQSTVVYADYIALTDAERALWHAILLSDDGEGVNVQDPDIRNQILGIWKAGTTTRTNVAAIQTKTGTRAEELGGDGTIVSHIQISRAIGG